MSSFEHFHNVTSSEANDIITELDPVILDVRTPSEFKEGHIEGAVNLPVDNLNESSILEVFDDADAPILVYCKSGVRSARACAQLSEMGSKGLFNLTDGIMAWPFGVVC